MANLPRGLFVAIVLVLAVAVIMLLNPPHTVCNSQFEIFKEKQTPFLYLDKEKEYRKTTGFERVYERCFSGNNLGSCAELFSGIQTMINHIQAGNPECHQSLFRKKEVKKAMEDTMTLMVRLAWGNEPPKSMYERNGWLNANHMFLFCNMTEFYKNHLGQNAYERWRESMLTSLPNPNNLPRGEVWKKSIFSLSCDNF